MGRVMVVDDDEVLRLLYSEMLGRLGLKVVASLADGRSAVDFLKQGNQVDLIIMDYRMPVMDGITAMNEIRRAGCNIPVIFASSDRSVESDALESGAAAVLLKPFSTENFLSTIKKLQSGEMNDSN